MFFKNFILSLAFIAAFSFPLFGANVSFLVIETGLTMDSGSNQHSSLWESGLLDVFFDAGHIVSNAPIMRLENLPAEAFPPEAQKDLDDAIAGGMEYFIIAVLEYNPSAGVKPFNVTVSLFKSKTCEMIYKMQYKDTKSNSLKEEFENIKKAVKGLVPRIK